MNYSSTSAGRRNETSHLICVSTIDADPSFQAGGRTDHAGDSVPKLTGMHTVWDLASCTRKPTATMSPASAWYHPGFARMFEGFLPFLPSGVLDRPLGAATLMVFETISSLYSSLLRRDGTFDCSIKHAAVDVVSRTPY